MGDARTKREASTAVPLAPAPAPPVTGPALGIAGWQRTAGNRATTAVLQRMVHRIGADDESRTNAANLVDAASPPVAGRRTLTVRGSERPLSALEEEETLHVVGHGDGAGHIEGMDARTFVEYLVEQGLDTARHRGTIRLISCFSATATAAQVLLSQTIVEELRSRGFNNAVVSFDGLVLVATTGDVEVVAPADVKRFDQIRLDMAELVEEATLIAIEISTRALAALLPRPTSSPAPAQEPSNEELEARSKAVQAELADLRAQAEALKHPWKLGANTRHVPYAQVQPELPGPEGPTGS